MINIKMINRRLMVVIILISSIFIISGCTTNDDTTESFSIRITTINNQVINVTLRELKNLESVTSYASFENSYGNIRGGEYIGVKITTIIEKYNFDIKKGDVLVVHATDNYKTIYTYDNIYPNETWEKAQGQMVLAYSYNDTEPPEWDMGPQIAFITSDGLYSNEDKSITSSMEVTGSAGSRWIGKVYWLEFKRENASVLFDSESKDYNLTYSQLQFLPSITGSGRYLKTTGAIGGPYTYKGVDMVAALELLINTSEDFSITVYATDGYKMTYTKEQVYGKVPVYDENQKEIGYGSYGKNLSLVLAYEEGGKPLSSILDYSFRMVYVGDGDPITDGHFWTKSVMRIEIGKGLPEWSITLTGLSEVIIDQGVFDSIVFCKDKVHYQKYSYTDDTGRVITYEGFPLWLAISIIDGGEENDSHYQFNDELAANGYTVTLYSSDGTNISFDSSFVARNDLLILSHVKNGIPLPDDEFPVRLVSSELTEDQWLGKITNITITDIPGIQQDWEIVLTNNIDPSFSNSLKYSDYLKIFGCSFHHKSITYTADNGTSIIYEGVPLYVIVAIFDGNDGITHYSGFNYSFNDDLLDSGYTVKVIGQNGSSWEFDSQYVAYNNSIILAYLKNGTPLDEEYGPLCLVGEGFTNEVLVAAISEIIIIPR